MKDMHTATARWGLLVVLVAALVTVGCGSDDGGGSTDAAGGGDATSGPSIEVAGSWTGSFGDEVITAAAWNEVPVVEFDNDANVAITKNADDAPFGPGKFNKIVWIEPVGEVFFYCTVDYGLDSAEAAKATAKTADPSDPEKSGCGDFPWSKLTRK